HADAVADRVQVERDVQLVDLSMMEQQVAARPNENGGIEDLRPGSLDQARGNVDIGVFRRLGEPCEMRTWNRLCEVAGGRMRPANFEAFGQNDDAASEVAGATDRGHSPVEIGRRFAALDEDLGHVEAER